MSKTILVVAAHTDDEALGCAGTIAKHVAQGSNVHLLFMTDGVGSRNVGKVEEAQRLAASRLAARILKVSSCRNLDFPDNRMDTIALLDVVKEIEKVIELLKPDVIYTHHHSDLNIDHQVTHKAVITACRPQPNLSVREIYAFEVLSSTEWQIANCCPFTPTMFVDISEYIDIKTQVLNAYSEEMREAPHSRSTENAIRLNAIRGNSVGLDYVEAFETLRCLK